MGNRTINAVTLVMITLCLSVLFIPTLQTPTEEIQPKFFFTIAGWDYPDEYSQGVYYFVITENSTGSWVFVCSYYHNYTSYGGYTTTGNVIEFENKGSVKFTATVFINSTVLGISDPNDGAGLIRMNCTVTNTHNNQIVWSKANITRWVGVEDDMGDGRYRYAFTDVMNFIPVFGGYYEAVFTFEAYYDEVVYP